MSDSSTAAKLSVALQPVMAMLSKVSLDLWRKSVYLLLGAFILFVLAQLLWLFLPSAEPLDVPTTIISAPVSGAPVTKVDVAAIQSQHLFGELGAAAAAEQAVPTVDPELGENAKPTRLNLQLMGVVYSSDPSQGLAVIVYQNNQEQYAVGDKLPVGRVSLAKVLTDHVIIDNGGNYESLWLFEEQSKQAATRSAQPRASVVVNDMRGNEAVDTMAEDYRQRLYQNPNSLADVVRIVPAQKAGKMIGYRVSPGKDRKQFAQFGFKSGDIVTGINGIDLNDPAQALQVYKTMRSAQQASFTVDRNGSAVEIVVSLGVN